MSNQQPEELSGREAEPIVQMAKAVFQDLAEVDEAERVAAIEEIRAALAAYMPEGHDDAQA